MFILNTVTIFKTKSNGSHLFQIINVFQSPGPYIFYLSKQPALALVLNVWNINVSDVVVCFFPKFRQFKYGLCLKIKQCCNLLTTKKRFFFICSVLLAIDEILNNVILNEFSITMIISNFTLVLSR